MRFSEATAVHRIEPSTVDGATVDGATVDGATVDGATFATELDPEWTIGGHRMNGGVLLAAMARAVGAAGDPRTPDPVAVSAQFLCATSPGPATVRVEPVKQGRSVGVWRAVLAQDGRDAVDATVTTGRLEDDPEVLWAEPSGIAPEPVAALDPRDLSDSGPFEAMRQVDFRLETASAPYLRGETGPPRMRMWARPVGAEPDLLFALVACDIAVPVPYNVGHLGWAPTVQLTALLRARPAPGWLGADLSAASISGGWFDENAVVTDSRGVIVCQSRQLALLPK